MAGAVRRRTFLRAGCGGRRGVARPAAADSARVRGVLRAADVISNTWSPNGELLLDEQGDASQSLDLLVAGLGKLPWALLWFAMLPLEASRWQAFRRLDRRGRRIPAGVLLLDRARGLSGGWEQCTAGWSKNHRRNLRKDQRRLESRDRCN